MRRKFALGFLTGCMFIIFFHDIFFPKEVAVKFPKEKIIDQHNGTNETNLYKQKRIQLGYANIEEISELVKSNNDSLPTKSHFGSTKWEDICENEDAFKCVQKIVKDREILQSHFLVPSMHIMACLIQKNSNTILKAILCSLYNETDYDKFIGKDVVEAVYKDMACANMPMYSSISDAIGIGQIKEQDLLEKWNIVTIVRDPIDRFISGFIDECYSHPLPLNITSDKGNCNGCKFNLTCFVITEYERMMNQSWRIFKESTPEDWHFYPQNWHCMFRKFMQKYSIVKYDRLTTDKDRETFLEKIINALNNETSIDEKKLSFIRKNFKRKSVHTTAGSNATDFIRQRLYGSPFLMEFIIRMFYWDFKMFGFQIPQLSFNFYLK